MAIVIIIRVVELHKRKVYQMAFVELPCVPHESSTIFAWTVVAIILLRPVRFIEGRGRERGLLGGEIQIIT